MQDPSALGRNNFTEMRGEGDKWRQAGGTLQAQAGPVGTLRKRLGGTCPYSLPEEVTLTHMKPSNRNIRRYLDHVDHVKM